MSGIVGSEVGKDGINQSLIILVGSGQGLSHEVAGSVADHLHVFIAGMLREASLLHGVVDRRAEVVERVEQSTVKVEYHQFVFHNFTR